MLESISHWYTTYFGPQNAAPGIFYLPFLGYPTKVLLICAIYLIFVLKIGPSFMQNRKAFDLKTSIFTYNALQIIVNFLIFYYSIMLQVRYRAYSLNNWKALPKEHPQKSIEVWTSYAYFLLKIVDLMDTVFFVLRKSSRQISFLHVYHHLTMISWTYMAMHFYGAAEFVYLGKLVNSFVHCVMYGYYLLSAQFPQYRSEIIKFKKYITRLQLIQFVFGILNVMYLMQQKRNDAGDFDFYCCYTISQLLAFVYLFGKFYMQSYVKKKVI